jgi:hypothetical protein
MAKVFLDSGESFTVNDDSVSVFGNSGVGTEVVVVGSGVAGLVLDQNIERVQFTATGSGYKYLQDGNRLKVYDSTGTVLLATIPLQDDGSQLAFSEGTVDAELSTSHGMTLGGAAVSSTMPASVASLPDTSKSTLFSVAAGAPTATEGGVATFVITLSEPQNVATAISYFLTGVGSAVVGLDFGTAATVSGAGISSSGNTLVFAEGSRQATVNFPVFLDTTVETGEGIQLSLDILAALPLMVEYSAVVMLEDAVLPFAIEIAGSAKEGLGNRDVFQ